MIAVYIRVSTDEQNPESQRAEIQAWLERNHIPESEVRWFVDKWTGKTAMRPEFQQLLKGISRGVFDTVICWKLDRLSRNFLDGIRLIGDWTERGIRIVSVTQAIDLNGMTGRLVAAVLFAVAEMELAHLKERQAAGIKVAQSHGKYKGRKPGSKKGSPQRARELHSKGLTHEEIAQAMGITRRTVIRYLQGA